MAFYPEQREDQKEMFPLCATFADDQSFPLDKSFLFQGIASSDYI